MTPQSPAVDARVFAVSPQGSAAGPTPATVCAVEGAGDWKGAGTDGCGLRCGEARGPQPSRPCSCCERPLPLEDGLLEHIPIRYVYCLACDVTTVYDVPWREDVTG